MTTKIGQTAQELSRTNPWWRDRDWAEKDQDLGSDDVRRLDYRSACLAGLRPGGLYLLRGPRRVGKTVAVKQAIESLVATGTPPRAIVRVAADGWSARDLRTVTAHVALPRLEGGQQRWWFIEEATAVTGDWATQIKWLRDNDPAVGAATVVLTGSNAESITAGSGILAGCGGQVTHANRTLLPIGFRTFARLLDPDLPGFPRLTLAGLRAADAYEALIPWFDRLVGLWEDYLTYGGFPAAVAAARDGKPIPESFIDAIFDAIFHDAFSESRQSVSSTADLVGRLMGAMGSPASVRKMAEDVDMDHLVVKRHLDYLRDAYLLWSCPSKQTKSWRPHPGAQQKLYAVDPLLARLMHLRNPGRLDIDPTILNEMQVGMAVQRAAESAGRPWSDDAFLFFHRTPARKEIDFVSEEFGGAALEARYIEDGSWHAQTATVDASEWDGILLTRNVLDFGGPDAWTVPAGFFAYLVDT